MGVQNLTLGLRVLDEIFYRMQRGLPGLRMGEGGKKVKSILDPMTK